jgi:hypothetical protein
MLKLIALFTFLMINKKGKPLPPVEFLIKSIENSVLNVKSRSNGEFSQTCFHTSLLDLTGAKVKTKEQILL